MQGSGRTGHVRLHLFHTWCWLEGDAAGIERDALTHDRQVLSFLGRRVGNLDQARATLGAAANTDDAAETLLGEAFLIPHFNLDLCAGGLLLSVFGESLREQVSGGGVDEGTDLLGMASHDSSTLNDLLDRLIVGQARCDNSLLERVAFSRFGRLVGAESPRTQ